VTDRRTPVSGASDAALVLVVVFFGGLVAPGVTWFVGGLRIAPFFGEYPRPSEIAAVMPYFWTGFGLSLLTLAFAVSMIVRRRGRISTGWSVVLVVLAVIGLALAGLWGTVAVSQQLRAAP